MQLQRPPNTYPIGVLAALRQIAAEDGVYRGLLAPGLAATTLRSCTYVKNDAAARNFVVQLSSNLKLNWTFLRGEGVPCFKERAMTRLASGSAGTRESKPRSTRRDQNKDCVSFPERGRRHTIHRRRGRLRRRADPPLGVKIAAGALTGGVGSALFCPIDASDRGVLGARGLRVYRLGKQTIATQQVVRVRMQADAGLRARGVACWRESARSKQEIALRISGLSSLSRKLPRRHRRLFGRLAHGSSKRARAALRLDAGRLRPDLAQRRTSREISQRACVCVERARLRFSEMCPKISKKNAPLSKNATRTARVGGSVLRRARVPPASCFWNAV